MYVLPLDRFLFLEPLLEPILLYFGLNGLVGLMFGNSDLWVDDLVYVYLLFSSLQKMYLRTS